MSSEACCRVRVDVGRSYGRHKANPSFHAITKIARILETLAVLMMGINESVKETQHNNTILKALQEHPGDQVM